LKLLSFPAFWFSVKYKIKNCVKKLPPHLKKNSFYLTGGKHLRSRLMYKTASICSLPYQKVTAPAAVLEILHTATLIHDDIIDEQKQRRGSATINSFLPPNITALSADQFLINALKQFASVIEQSVLLRFLDKGQQVCRGEIRQDFSFNISRKITAGQCLELTRHKTGSLFALALATPGYLADYNKKLISFLEECGYYFGTVFQITDDYRDILYDSRKKKLQHWTLPLKLWQRNDNASFSRKLENKNYQLSYELKNRIARQLRDYIMPPFYQLQKKADRFNRKDKALAAAVFLLMTAEIEKICPFFAEYN